MVRYFVAVVIFVFSSSVFADWVDATSASYCSNTGPTNACANTPPLNTAWRWRYWRNDGPSCVEQFICQKWSPNGTSPCDSPQEWNQQTQQCGYPEGFCADKSGEDAGMVENSPTAPGYELLCYSGCAVEVAEFFQRTDNNNWVIAYRYTGQECGPGDPLGEPDLPPGEEGPPAINPHTPPDTDGDGIPDDNDDDIDGDGIPNSEDDDKDGDGIPDNNDPSPGGPGEQERESSAHVALNCAQSPSCSGDAIECAQLVELWRLRCKGGGDSEQVDESLATEIISDVNAGGVDGLIDVAAEIESSLSDPAGITLSSGLTSGFTNLFPTLACTDLAFEFKGSSFVIPCSKTADFRELLRYVLYVMTAIYLYHLARKPVGE